MRSQTCPEANWLCEYVDGALPRGRREAVARHLCACASCRAEVAGLERLRAAMLSAAAAPAPADLPERITRLTADATAIAPITCRAARRLLDGELDGQLETAEHEGLWAHLFNCVGCLRRFEERKRVVTTLRVPVAAEAPAELAGRIRAAVAALGTQRVRRPRRSWARAGAALAAASVLLALMFTIHTSPPVTPGGAPGLPGPSVTIAPSAVPAGPAAAASATTTAGRMARTAKASPPSARVAAVPPRTAPGARAAVRPGATPRARTPLPPAVRPKVARPAVLPVPSPTEAPRIAATPPAPLAPAPVAIPPATPSARPLVAHHPTPELRELRLVPVQPASVVVFQRQPGNDVALAEAGRALNDYERSLKRAQTREIVIAR